MQWLLESPALVLVLFMLLLAVLEAGRRLGLRRPVPHAAGTERGVAAVEGAVFALFGLLLAFTFTSAATRYDERRDLIAQEANAIGTAWLRLDLLPAAQQPEARALMRRYVQARLAQVADVRDAARTAAAAGEVERLQAGLWALCSRAAQAAPTPVLATVLLPALNDMIDITTTRAAAAAKHPPMVIFGMLLALSLAATLLAGYAMSGDHGPPLLHMVAFAAVTAATLYVIVELEYPRLGFVRLDATDALLRDLLRTMR